MPMNRSLYPANWTAIALGIKAAADWHCEACGRPCLRHNETKLGLIERLPDYWWEQVFDYEFDDTGKARMVCKLGRFTLTVAHLNHQPSDCRPENLRALCSVCHCRYDLAAMELKKRLKREREGQLTLPVREDS